MPLFRLLLMGYPQNIADSMCEDIQAMVDAHTVDAVPVMRGEWTYEINEYFRTCSVCRISQALLAGENLSRFKYCPFCGAKMESEGNA